MTSTCRNEIKKPSTYTSHKKMAHYEIFSTMMKFLGFLFECYDFYGRLAYAGSALFWCFRCQLEQLHRCGNGVSYCKYCWMSYWVKFVIS